MAAEDPRYLLHFRTLKKFNEKLAEGVVSDTRHLCFIADEQLIWCRGKYYNDGTKLGDISNFYNDWELTQTSATTITITIKGKQWDEDKREFKDISKSFTIQSATRTVAGLQSAADKTKLDGLNENNVSNIAVSSNASQATITVSKDNGLAADTTSTLNFPIASPTVAGTMSASDKTKLNRITGTNYTLNLSKKDGSTNTITLSGINPNNGTAVKADVILATATRTEAGLISADLLNDIEDKFLNTRNFSMFSKSTKPADAETSSVAALTDQDNLDMYTEGNLSLHMHNAGTALGIKHDDVTQSLVTPTTGEVINKVTSDSQGHLLTTTKTDLINRAKKLDHSVTINLTNVDSKNGVTGTATSDLSGTTINIATEISPIDASKITSGTIDLARLPQGALERLTIVTDQAAMLKLTSTQVQNGDTVKNEATNEMFYVKDQTQLGSMAAFEVYTAGRASEAPWSGITGKPTSIQITNGTNTPISSSVISLRAGAIKIPTTIAAATGSANGLMSSTDKTEHDRITTANFALGAVTPSTTAVAIAATKTTISSGASANNNITIPGVTTTKAGVMSSADKVALNDHKTQISSLRNNGASHYDNVSTTASQVNVNFKCWFGDGNIQDHFAPLPAATTTKAGVMTAADKVKLDTTLPTQISTETTNRVNADNAINTKINSLPDHILGRDLENSGSIINPITAADKFTLAYWWSERLADGSYKVNDARHAVDIPAATTALAGVMTAADKTKLNGIATGANKYVHPAGNSASKASGLYKFSTDGTSHINSVTSVVKSDITALGIPAQDTVYTHPVGGAPSKASGFYKFSTDSLSHISAVTAVTKADITGLGIPGSNTTYTFASGTGGFTVTPSGGTAQTVSIGKPSTAGTADTANKTTGTLTINGTTFNGSTNVSITTPNTDTKNTAGSTNSASKLFLIGATSQGANPVTYSNSAVYATAGTLVASKMTAAGGFWKESDVRLKSNIKPLEHTLEDICSIPTVSFTMNGEEQIGTIAQDLEEKFPELVFEQAKPAYELGADASKFDTYLEDGVEYVKVKKVEYEMLSTLAIEGIKLLKAEIDALKAQINK